MSREWNYHPDLPLPDSSIFCWPPDPRFLAGWFARNWLTLSERVMMVGLAVALWAFAYPSVTAAESLAFGWIAQVWLINMAMMIVVAGGLHLVFYILKTQGKALKFDHRDQARGNARQCTVELPPSSAGQYVLVAWVRSFPTDRVSGRRDVGDGEWLCASDQFRRHPIWFLTALILLPIWSAFHFYWVHRLLHVPMLYRHVHSLHHRNVNIGPWSGLSMHPLEHFVYFTTLLIHFIVPSHPIHLIFHVIYQGPGAAMTHTGYEDMLVRDKRRLALGTFYHQLHHRYYECNYGNQEMPWDRWFGTFHDGSEDGTAETRARKKRMYQ